ncbi:MAG: SDR family oxidoreductase [Streptosporangiaceae bacterium]|nr:SDR family oxidoreductase [Streptosporangiaceae bacterium]MBV9853029.1 SDR family oxidoreductase [Streptosporangiaceae bacterium]
MPNRKYQPTSSGAHKPQVPPGTAGPARPRLAAGAASIFDSLIPLARHASPGEVARVMLFLASGGSSFVTGATPAVDGGMST